MARNEFIADERVVDAAMSLAKMVKEHNKPIVFDMRKYMEIVVGLTEVPMSKLLETFLFEEGDPNEKEKEQLRKDLKARKAATSNFAEHRKQFVAALSDAFTFTEIYRIQPCVLVEIGYAPTGFAMFDDGGWVFAVTPEPKLETSLVLDL